MVDEAGALACMKHSRQRVVTVAIDRMTFKHPIRIGDLVTINAEVSYVGSSSMEAEVTVRAENPTTGEHWHTNTAYLVYVALNEQGKPTMSGTWVLLIRRSTEAADRGQQSEK